MSIPAGINPERIALFNDARLTQERLLAEAAIIDALSDSRKAFIQGAKVIIFRPDEALGFPSPVAKPDQMH